MKFQKALNFLFLTMLLSKRLALSFPNRYTSLLKVSQKNGMKLYSSKLNEDSKSIKKPKKKEESKYSKTVSLPQTSFDQRANSLIKEPEIQKWWDENKVYESLSESNQGEKFILHDGPPYANGNLHIGHALNKILKDFINKYQTLKGKKVRYVPGWDCHGLPIELKVLQGMKSQEREGLTPLMLRKKAAVFAKETVATQRTAFKRYGVWGDWERPYMTLQPEYESAQIAVFEDMVNRGHIYRGKKPVHWSPSSRTALAEAELEYPENHISRSIYVGFKATFLSKDLESAIAASSSTADVVVAIWTTTPWTIPANLAIAVNAELDYCVAYHSAVMSGAKIIVAKDLLPALSAKAGLNVNEGEKLEILAELKGSQLAGTKYQHPLYDRQSEIVIGGDYITTESGTGLVHTAPGHGQEDYLTGLKYGLPLLSPVNDLGCFTDEAGPRFAGLDVLGSGNEAVINALRESGSLIKEEAYNHKYPYDWRTKKPTIFRATEQWFASVSTFREDALAAIESVEWIPAVGKNRISSMTESRGDWCISRQRSWGVPIPVFYNIQTNEPLMTPATLAHIQEVFRVRGSDAWWELTVEELLPPQLKDQAHLFTKGSDTMDVWFDSGTSWAGVARQRDELQYPADIYLEGSDQHRGWFQSSLLTSVASQGIAPYKKVLTHGFVLDEKGYKMSKSLGNVIDPKDIIEGGPNQKEKPAYGADTLRLWISGVDYTSDVCVGTNIIKQVSETYRKLRNTVRYLLGSLSDFDPAIDAVPYEKLPAVDKYILGKLSQTVQEVESAYDSFQFSLANQELVSFATSDLSAFYLDVAKDRLYISTKNDERRRSCQTVIAKVLEQLIVLMAPLTPHMAEEAWQSIPYPKSAKSIFQKGWVSADERSPTLSAESEKFWNQLKAVRGEVNRCIERARQAKLVGASMECRVFLHTSDAALKDALKTIQGDSSILPQSASTNGVDDLRFLLLVSQVNVVDSVDELTASCPQFNLKAEDVVAVEVLGDLTVGVTTAAGSKCDRCWFYSDNVGHDHEHPELCLRCADVIKVDGHTP